MGLCIPFLHEQGYWNAASDQTRTIRISERSPSRCPLVHQSAEDWAKVIGGPYRITKPGKRPPTVISPNMHFVDPKDIKLTRHSPMMAEEIARVPRRFDAFYLKSSRAVRIMNLEAPSSLKPGEHLVRAENIKLPKHSPMTAEQIAAVPCRRID